MTTALILVVEDQFLIARDIAMQLRKLGYEATGPAGSGEEAIEMAGRFRPDLVLMDIQLRGGMDGITAAQTILNQYAIPTVFLSGFDHTTHTRALSVNPVGFLPKPFSEADLRRVMQTAVATLAAKQ